MQHNFLTRLLLTLTLLLGFSPAVWADEHNEAARYAGFEALPAAQEGDIVFIGNSITHMMNWWEAYGNKHNVHGRGNSGAKTYQALANLESMIAGQPSKAFVMLGTNDFGDNDNAQHVALLVKTLCKRIRLESPATTVYLQSILPSGVGYRKGRVNDANVILKAWIEEQHDAKLVYIDLFSLFDDGTGSIKNRGANQDFTLSYDDLHLTPIGYRMWMEKIKELSGLTTVIPEGAKNLHAGQQTSWGARIATFGTMPVTNNDILMFGDDFIHYGEWHEMISSSTAGESATDFKDRGTGWQFFSSNISRVQAALEPALSKTQYNVQNCGVKRATPRAICISAGGRNIMDGTDDNAIKQAYLGLVNAARAQVESTTPIFLMSILPLDNATKNAQVKTLNAYMQTLANEKANVYYVDLYSAMTTGDAQTTKYFHANRPVTISGTTIKPYPTPLGYVKAANVLCEKLNSVLGTHYTAISESSAQANIDRFAARTIVGNAVNDAVSKLFNVGDAPGQYSAASATDAETTIANACKVLYNGSTLTTAAANSAIAPLANLSFEVVMPKVSDETHQYIYTISDARSNKFITAANGVNTLTSNATASGATDQQWKLTKKADGSYNIQNVLTGGYLNMTSDITTSATVPTKGWTLKPIDGYFAIVSGTDQINVNGSTNRVYNWGSGTNGPNGNDTGCYFRFVLADEIVPPVVVDPTLPYGEGSGLNNLMPRPQKVKVGSGTYTGKIADAKVEMITAEALTALGAYDYTVEGFDNEGYQLIITTSGITIKAATELGVIRAKQTLAQMDQNGSFDCCEIVDWPAFKVRGLMHDVGRSFITFDELKKEIELLARFKVNMFHWHLTDHQGFRFETKHSDLKVLNTSGTRFDSQFYTQDQCKELDAYAKSLGVCIIPEIDMPGHSTVFKNALGYTMESTQGKEALKRILDELVECFPNAPYIHIGGDETSAATKAYVNEMAAYVKEKSGKKAGLWNKYGAGLVTPSDMPNIGFLTNWATSGTLVNGVPNVDMRYFYVNHFDVFADLAGAYRSLIFNAEKGNSSIGGISIGIWNDRYLSDQNQILAQNNVYAAVLAVTERAWCGGTYEGNQHQYIEKGRAYLPNEGWEYDEFADWERRFLVYKNSWLKNEPIPYVKQTNVRWNITKSYDNGGDKTKAFPIETATDLTVEPGSTFATGAGVWLNHIWAGTVNGVFPSSQSKNQTRYAWTYVYSPTAQKVGAQIEFYNYSRSDGGNVPEAGKWDRMGSRVWVNDAEVLPTWQWTQGTGAENDLGNLNFPGRKPVQVDLKQGWNKVLIKLPYVDAGLQRGNKWQYTFVFTDTEGKNAVEGLVYSPSKSINGTEDFTVPELPRVAPTPYTEADPHVYRIKSRRGGYYIKDNGKGTTLSTNASTTTDSDKFLWKFVERSKGVYDIVSYSTGGYISPNAANNNPLSCVEAKPSAGWTLANGSTETYFIVTNGTTQLHNDKSNRVLNWGYGSKVANQFNTTDDGCEFIFEEVEGIGSTEISDIVTIDKANGHLYKDGNQNDSGWSSIWKSDTNPIVTLTASANNMQWSGNNIDARSGLKENSTYTLAVPAGYVIASYSFDAQAIGAGNTQTWKQGTNTYNVTQTATTKIAGTNVNEQQVVFTLTGSNSGTLLTNFTVSLKATDPADVIEHEIVMTRTNNIDYRIPAVAKNQNGDLIFVADYRYSGADIGVKPNGKLDLHYRIKRANGTWEPVKTLAKCIEGTNFTAYGDPCIVADRTSNRVMVTSCCGNVSFPNGNHSNHQGWARFYSEDGGETWETTHTDISDQVFKQLDKRADGEIRCFFIGSGKISQSTRVKVGEYYRLYCAALVKTGNNTNVNYVFFSDDFGQNWTLLGDVDDCPIPTGGDEPKAEELPDGSVIISSRTGGRLFNVFHFTDVKKGTGKWGNATLSTTANNGTFGAGCNGEIMIVPVQRAEDGKKTYLALQSIPAASTRNNVSIYYKELTNLNLYRNSALFAPNWSKYQVSTTTSGYSTMVLDKDNDVAFFFEENYLDPGYDMVYCKLPIEKITGNKYSYCTISDEERKAYLTAGASAYFDTQDYCSEEPIASLVSAYVDDPSDENYCALNAVLNEIITPSANAQECPYASPAPVGGMFNGASQAYTMQIKGDIYITTNSMTDGAFNVNNKTAPTTAEGYWVIAGSKDEGYHIYNVGAGATKVLGVTGAEDAARTALYDVDDVPANVKTAFSYHANTYGGSTTGATFFVHGTDNNALNVRAPYFALWNSGSAFTDNGSRIELTKVNYNFQTVGIESIGNGNESGTIYDLQGRPYVGQPKAGFYIKSGRKVIR